MPGAIPDIEPVEVHDIILLDILSVSMDAQEFFFVLAALDFADS